MQRTYEHLSAEERGFIMAMKQQGESARAIAKALHRAPSTICRELRRNGYKPPYEIGPIGRPRVAGGYDALRAGKRARRLKYKVRRVKKLDPAGLLWAKVRALLEARWSPEQIAGRLKQDYPGQQTLHVSHETIYTAIYAAPKGALRRELVALLRQGRGARRPRTRGTDRRGQLQDIASIHVRPPEANERLLPGHWEGDFLVGAGNRSAVGTLVCRKTLLVVLAKMDGCTAAAALEGFARAFAPFDEELCKTLTYDQGKEMAYHQRLEERTGLKIYFADPHSPWQRGINENTNGLLREYLPKGADLSQFTQQELDQIAWSLNNRPRKSLGFKKPSEAFWECCFNLDIRIPSTVALGA